MARKLTALLLGVMLLLCGCGSPGAASATGEETVELVGQPYDYDLTEYLELRDYTGIRYTPLGNSGRTVVEW